MHFGVADLALAFDLNGNPETGERIMGRSGIEGYLRIVNQTVYAQSQLETDALPLRALQHQDRVYIVADWPDLAPAQTLSINVYARGRFSNFNRDLQYYIGIPVSNKP